MNAMNLTANHTPFETVTRRCAVRSATLLALLVSGVPAAVGGFKERSLRTQIGAGSNSQSAYQACAEVGKDFAV